VSGNPYEKTAGELFGSGTTPAPPANPYTDAAQTIFGDPNEKLRSALDVASRGDANAAAQAIKNARAIGVTPDVAYREPKIATQKAHRQTIDVGGIVRDSPVFAQWASDRQNAAVAHDDVEALTGLEALTGRWQFGPSYSGVSPFAPAVAVPGLVGRAFDAAAAGRTLAAMQARAGDLRVDPETMPGYAELAKAAEGPDLTERGFGTRSVVRLASILPGLATGITRGAAYGAVAEGAAIAAGSAGGPGGAAAGAAAGLLGPSEVGFLVGMGKDIYDSTYGSAYAETVQRMKQAGARVDFEIAHRQAVLSALAAAALQTGGNAMLAGLFPAIAKIVTSPTAVEAAKKALAPALGPALSALKAVWRSIAGTAEISAVMGAQGASTAAQVEAGVEQAGGQPDFSRTGPAALQAAKDAFESFFLLGAFGALGNYAADIHTYRRAVEARARMQKLGEIVSASKLQQRLPEKTGELAGELIKAGAAPETLYVPFADFVQYWQEQNIDPAEIAKQLDAGSSFETARATRADVSIPFDKYVEKVASSKHHQGMSEIAKFEPEDRTPKQADALLKEMPERTRALAEEMAAQAEKITAAPEVTVREEIAKKLVATGMREEDAQVSAELPAALFRTLETRTGQEQGALSSPYKLQIVRPDLESTRPTTTPERTRPGPGKPEAPTAAGAMEARLALYLGDGADDALAKIKAGETESVSSFDLKPGEVVYHDGVLGVVTADANGDAVLSSSKGDIPLGGFDSLDVIRLGRSEVVKAIPEPLAAPPESTTLAQDAGKEKRGYIKFTKGSRSFEIGLLENANLSTFLHETGHFFLEVMGDVVDSANVTPELKADYETALKHLGVKSRDELTPSHHEKWARSFEAYLMEGKAPSVSLAGAFERFRSWLVSIYRKLSLGVKLTDEVRGVMDRLIATDDEIAKAESQMAAAPMFLTMDDGAMTIAQWERYRDTANQATADARAELQDRLLSEVRRERKAWWKEESAQVQEKVTTVVDATPAHRANSFFRRGEMLSGEPVPEDLKAADGSTMKLSRQGVFELFGGGDEAKQIIRRLNFALGDKDAISPEAAAPFFGFQSGAEMVKGMLAAGSRAKAIADGTKAAMIAKHGDVMSDGSMAIEAQKAAHSSEGRLRLYEAEHAALTRKAGGGDRLVPIAAMKKIAESQVARLRVRDINAGILLRAEATANRAAREAERRGEWETARTETQRAMFNHLLYRASIDAREEMDTARGFLEKSDQPATRARLGKAGANYLDNQDKLLERFDFKRATSLKESDRRQTLVEWISEQEANGLMADIPDYLIDESRRTSWKNLTVEEMRGLRDSVKNIQHLARLKNDILTGREKARMDAVRQEIIATEAKTMRDRGPLQLEKNVVSWAEKRKSQIRSLDADLENAETYIRWLDGEDITGPHHRYMWDAIEAGKIKELDMQNAISKRMIALLDSMPAEIRKNLTQIVNVEGWGEISRLTLLGIALHVGNESNYSKLERGYKLAPGVLDRTAALLTDAELDYVQGIWDIASSLEPEAATLYKRRTGLEFPKVEARPFEVRRDDGTTKEMRGGYFHIDYDRNLSLAGESSTAESIAQLFEDSYARAVTAKGYSKERNENFARPINLQLNTIPAHFDQVIHDIALGDAVTSVGKVLFDPDISMSIKRHIGVEGYGSLVSWLKGTANYQVYSMARLAGEYTKWIERRRAATTVAVLGAKATIMAGNFANLVVAMHRIGPTYMAKGLAWSIRNPIARWREAAAASGEIRHRFTTFDRDMREDMMRLHGRTDLKAQATRFAYALTAFTDVVTAVPIWYAGREQFLAKNRGGDMQAAGRAGDAHIRSIVSSGHPVDLPRVMRTRGPERLITMFYGYAGAQYRLLRTSMNDIERAKLDRAVGERLPIILGQATAVILGNAIAGELLASRVPSEDESWPGWVARKALLYPFELIPGVRDLARYGEGLWAGRDSFSASPLSGTVDRVVRAAKDIAYDIPTGQETFGEDVGDFISAGTFYYGVPAAGQIQTTGSYLWDLMNGETRYVDFPTFLHDMAYPRPEERR